MIIWFAFWVSVFGYFSLIDFLFLLFCFFLAASGQFVNLRLKSNISVLKLALKTRY